MLEVFLVLQVKCRHCGYEELKSTDDINLL